MDSQEFWKTFRRGSLKWKVKYILRLMLCVCACVSACVRVYARVYAKPTYMHTFNKCLIFLGSQTGLAGDLFNEMAQSGFSGVSHNVSKLRYSS